MKLQLRRDTFSSQSTLGKLYVDGEYFCETLERVTLAVQRPRESSIPEGVYQIELRPSPHLGYTTPHLLDVPGRSYILIHIANFPRELEGCIAVGMTRAQDAVMSSGTAFNRLLTKVQAALSKGEKVEIEVTDEHGGRGFSPTDRSGAVQAEDGSAGPGH